MPKQTYTFVVIQILEDDLQVIGNFTTCNRAIEVTEDMNKLNPDMKFVWVMVGKARD